MQGVKKKLISDVPSTQTTVKATYSPRVSDNVIIWIYLLKVSQNSSSTDKTTIAFLKKWQPVINLLLPCFLFGSCSHADSTWPYVQSCTVWPTRRDLCWQSWLRSSRCRRQQGLGVWPARMLRLCGSCHDLREKENTSWINTNGTILGRDVQTSYLGCALWIFSCFCCSNCTHFYLVISNSVKT